MENLLKLFGKRMRQLRKDKGFTQEALAELADLHPNYIGYVERGEKNPGLVSLEKLAAALGISLRELMPGVALSAEREEVIAELLDLLNNKSVEELRLAATVVREVFVWTEQAEKK